MTAPDGPVQEALWRHLTVLAEEIGPRVLGTENDRRAADYIERQFTSAGLAVTRDVYPCPSWEHESTRLCVLPAHPVDGLANLFSPAGAVTAELAVVRPRLRPPEREEVEGKVVLAPDIPGGVLGRNALAEHLEALGAAALIGVCSHGALAETKFFRTPNLKAMPVVCVSRPAGERLMEHAGERVRLDVECRRFDSESTNIIARTPGEGAVIVVGAHYDTAPLCPGAGDNGSGTATLIELACALAAEETAHPFEFIAFGGEEYGGRDGIGEGARQYARLHEDHVRDVLAMFAIDGVADVLATNVLHYDPSVPGSTAAARLAADDPTLALDPHLSGASDHVIFRQRGVPAMWLSCAGPAAPIHTPADDLTHVSPVGLENALNSALRLCRALDRKESL